MALEVRSRVVLAGLFATLLLLDGAAWSHAFATGRIETAALQFFPETMQGRTVTLSLLKVREVREDGYTVRQGRFDYDVVGSPGDLQVGEEVYVRGTFSGTNTVEEGWHERAPARGGKKLLGFIGLAVAAGVTLAGTRWTTDGLVLRG